MRWQTTEQIAAIPMRCVGPVKITGPVMDEDVLIPLATFESPLWPSTHRGATVSREVGGIRAVVLDERMTRSVVLEVASAIEAHEAVKKIRSDQLAMQSVVEESSRFARLLDLHTQIVGPLIYLRFEYFTGDAAGHNMATLATERVLHWLLERYPQLEYVSISGNYCSDKKVSAVNGILGRGRSVIAEMTIPRAVCQRFLKTTPEKIVALNLKKNLMGNLIAGGLRTANAHFANMLLGFYLATGQDAANIVEGSQGIVYTALKEEALYFSVTLPNVIVGTVGNGKSLDFVQDNLRQLGCLTERVVGENARRLAVIAASAVLCGELSLMAAQTNPGELMKGHMKMERLLSGGHRRD